MPNIQSGQEARGRAGGAKNNFGGQKVKIDCLLKLNYNQEERAQALTLYFTHYEISRHTIQLSAKS